MGALARLVSLDPVAIGGEFYRDFRCLAVTADGSAVDAILAKPTSELAKEDARTLAAIGSAWAAAVVVGYDPIFAAAGISAMEWMGATGSQDSAWNVMKQTDEAKMMREFTSNARCL